MEHRWFPSEHFIEVQNRVGVSTVPDFVPYMGHVVVTSISCIETSCLKVRCQFILDRDTGPSALEQVTAFARAQSR